MAAAAQRVGDFARAIAALPPRARARALRARRRELDRAASAAETRALARGRERGWLPIGNGGYVRHCPPAE